MIDAGIWGQLPSLINAGIFADNTLGVCSNCAWPKVIPPPGIGNGFVGSGFTLVCSVNVVIPIGKTHQQAFGFFDYTPGVGDDLCFGCHSMLFRVDGGGGALDTDIILSNPNGNVRYQRSEGPVIDFGSAGTHTLSLIYTAATTGVGFDILWAATLSLCVV
jgi:hypothetical protein